MNPITAHTNHGNQANSPEGVPPSGSPQGSLIGKLDKPGEKETAPEVLMEKLCRAALNAFVRLGGKRVTEARSNQRERACAAMRESALLFYDEMIVNARATVGIEYYVFTNAVLEIAKAGLNVLSTTQFQGDAMDSDIYNFSEEPKSFDEWLDS